MLEAKNLFTNFNFNSSNFINTYQFAPRLRRHIYYTNHYKTIKVENKKNFPNLDLKQVKFDLLTIFYTVVTLGSLSKAAKRLGITQPAVSIALRKIEKEIGFLVFTQVNSKTSILLSPGGLILFNYTQRFFQIIQESEEISNLNHFQPPYPVDSKGLSLLSILNKKKLGFSLLESSLIKLFTKKHFFETTKLNFLFYESKSRLILVNKKTNLHHKLLKLDYKNSLVKSILFEKIFSFKVLNKSVYTTLKYNNVVEIHTISAYLTSLDMKISNSLYWGSEI